MKEPKTSVAAAAKAAPALPERFVVFSLLLIAMAMVCSLLLSVPGGPVNKDVKANAGYLNNLAYGAGSQALPSLRGQDYLAEVSQNGSFKWDASRFPLKVYIGDGMGTPGYRAHYRDMMARAFDEWSGGSGGIVSWRQVSSPQGADIVTTWSADAKLRSGGVEAGETRSILQQNKYTGNGTVLVARISILTQMFGRSFSDANMYKTCLHEVGHALGLEGHSNVASDIMYPVVNDQQITRLHSRDLNTITRLYAGAPLGNIARAPRSTGGHYGSYETSDFGMNRHDYGSYDRYPGNSQADLSNSQSADAGGLQPYTPDLNSRAPGFRHSVRHGRPHRHWYRLQSGFGSRVPAGLQGTFIFMQ